MATIDSAQQAILDQIEAKAPKASAEALRDLAEALAWLRRPDQPHGGSQRVTTN